MVAEQKVKVLAVFGHRPDKVASILSYSGLEYRVIVPKIIKQWRDYPPLARTALYIPTHAMLLFSPLYYISMIRVIRKGRFDVLFSHGGVIGFRVRILARLLRRKFVMRLGGHIYDEYRDSLRERSLARRSIYPLHFLLAFSNVKHADHIIVVTDDMGDKLAKESGRDRSTISTVPVPCDIARFDKPKIPHQGKVILTIINLNFVSKTESFLLYIPAVLGVLSKNENTRWMLVAPGRYAGRLRKYLSATCSQLLLARITVSDFIEDIEQEYQKADVFCYFSEMDGCPNVILEAWASRTPVIVNRCAWSKELIQHGVTGLLARDNEDADRHLNAILYSGNINVGLVESGYRYLTSHHTKEVAGKRLGVVLEGIV